MKKIAFIGLGRVGQTLARALAAQGECIVAVSGRRADLAHAFAAGLPGCQALPAEQAVAAADLVFLTVPDDAIPAVVLALPWRPGQAVVHCSGATELSALAGAAAAGALVGGFHPLQIFSDPERAAQLLAGSAVAIEAGAVLQARLIELAALLGMKPFELPPGARAAYHGAASFAASFLLSMLDEAVQLWAQIGLPEGQALPALLPLARGTLDAAQARGLAGALSGPLSRGDGGVVGAHLRALDALDQEAGAAAHGPFYRELARRQLKLARASGRLDEAALLKLELLLGPAGH